MRSGKFEISPLALLIFLVAYYLDREGIFALFLLAALTHEAGHLIAMRICGREYFRRATVRVQAFEAEISTGYMPPHLEFFCILAGPLSNFLLSGIVCALSHFFPLSEGVYILAGISLVLGLFNLLPVVSLDGGRLLRLVLELFTGSDRAGDIAFGISLAVSACLAGLSVMLGALYGTGYVLMVIAMLLLVKHLGCIGSANGLK